MNLVPVRPPGPNARKARAFAAEIAQLRAQGYTFEAIREALAGAGVHVSNSTVQREAARATRERPASTLTQAPDTGRREIQLPSTTSATEQARSAVAVAAPVRGAIPHCHRGAEAVRDFDCKQDAEGFFAAHGSNPLFNAKETS